MRALDPRVSAHIDRDGLAVHYEVYGHGEPAVFLLLPTPIVHSRAWKAQIPFLARSTTVVTIDPRGNGGSDRPKTAAQASLQLMIADAWAVLDAADISAAVLVGLCSGAGQAVVMAAERPDRVLGVVAINPGLQLTAPLPHRIAYDFDAPLDTEEGWAKQNRHYWRRDWRGFAEFFFAEMFPEPHSTKQREDCVAWAMEAGVQIVEFEMDAPADDRFVGAGAEGVCAQVRCPVLVISGSLDACQDPRRGPRLAELTGGRSVVIEGGGHLVQARDPVKVNLLLRNFVAGLG